MNLPSYPTLNHTCPMASGVFQPTVCLEFSRFSGFFASNREASHPEEEPSAMQGSREGTDRSGTREIRACRDPYRTNREAATGPAPEIDLSVPSRPSQKFCFGGKTVNWNSNWIKKTPTPTPTPTCTPKSQNQSVTFANA